VHGPFKHCATEERKGGRKNHVEVDNRTGQALGDCRPALGAVLLDHLEDERVLLLRPQLIEPRPNGNLPALGAHRRRPARELTRDLLPDLRLLEVHLADLLYRLRQRRIIGLGPALGRLLLGLNDRLLQGRLLECVLRSVPHMWIEVLGHVLQGFLRVHPGKNGMKGRKRRRRNCQRKSSGCQSAG